MSEDNVRNFGEEKNNVLKLVQPADKQIRHENDELIQALREHFTRFHVKNHFKEGDLVVWKDGFRANSLPLPNKPSIVIEVLDESRVEWDVDPSSTGYGMRYDIRLLVETVSKKDGEVSYIPFWYDSRHFTHFEGKTTDET